jgi:hypothetical protein
LFDRQLEALRGGALKTYEDTLDALLCAFIAAHYWAWGAERNEMIGTMAEGYIETPSRTVGGLPWSFEPTQTRERDVNSSSSNTEHNPNLVINTDAERVIVAQSDVQPNGLHYMRDSLSDG